MNAPINLRVIIHEKERVYKFDVVILEDESEPRGFEPRTTGNPNASSDTTHVAHHMYATRNVFVNNVLRKEWSIYLY